jgi:glycosyltransferase involved in cell wall biosynthesis
MLTDYFYPHVGGGVERVVYELSTRLIRDGHEVLVVTLNTDAAPRRERVEGIAVVRAPGIQLSRLTGMQVAISPFAPITAIQAIRTFRPDVLHAHSPFFFLSAIAPVLKALQGVPLITTLHVAEIEHLRGWTRIATTVYEATVARFLIAHSDQVTAVSEAAQRHAALGLHVDAHRITLIANGVDTERFRRAPASSHDQPSQRVVCVGRLIFNKGPQYLLAAAPSVLARHPATQFVFVGDGPMMGELRSTATEMGIRGSMQFTGSTDDVPGVLRDADILVRPSLSEGLPLTVLEAMSCGLPVVASAVGGTPEIVRDGVTGFLVPPGDSDVLAERINDLLGDPSLRKRMGDAARSFVERSYDWDQVAEEYVETYDLALRRRNAAARLTPC